MSPRRARRREDATAPLRTDGIRRTESHPDGEWVVAAVTAARAEKTYTCPGCRQEVRPGTAHVVAWPSGREDDRRHWHTPCWHRRDRLR